METNNNVARKRTAAPHSTYAHPNARAHMWPPTRCAVKHPTSSSSSCLAHTGFHMPNGRSHGKFICVSRTHTTAARVRITCAIAAACAHGIRTGPLATREMHIGITPSRRPAGARLYHRRSRRSHTWGRVRLIKSNNITSIQIKSQFK